MQYDAHQLAAIRSFIEWLCPMDSYDVVDIIDRLSEAETDEDLLEIMADIEADEDR